MPRFVVTQASGTLFNDIAVLALSPDPVASFSLLSLEVAFRNQTVGGPTDDGGLLDVSIASTAGSTPTNLVPKKCDPGSNGVNLVTPRWNYVTTPTRGTSIEKIFCPPRVTVYRSWEEGEFVIAGGSTPLVFQHLTGASMPVGSSYRLTVEWVE